MIKIDCKKTKGFSIGEVTLSVFILGVTMLTILTLYADGLRNFQDERDSVIASMLAQEGIEIARNVRDNNWARREGVNNDNGIGTFDKFDVSSGGAENDCRVSYDLYTINANEIDYNDPAISCNGSSYVLNIDGNDFYTHRAGSDTKFRRRMVLNYLDSENLIVTSLVSWGNIDPPDSISDCTVEDKCVFSQTTLTEWGTGT